MIYGYARCSTNEKPQGATDKSIYIEYESGMGGKSIGRPSITADSIPGIFYKHDPKYKQGKINWLINEGRVSATRSFVSRNSRVTKKLRCVRVVF